MRERLFGVRFFRTAKQAWKSEEPIPVWFAKRNLEKLGFQTFKYRCLNGDVYIFNQDKELILVTVIKYYGKNRFQ
jgi:hypothetical protein